MLLESSHRAFGIACGDSTSAYRYFFRALSFLGPLQLRFFYVYVTPGTGFIACCSEMGHSVRLVYMTVDQTLSIQGRC